MLNVNMDMKILKEEEDVLRLGVEPCRHLDDRDVHRILTASPLGFFQYVQRLLARIARGEAELEISPKQIFSDPVTKGDFRVMPCRLRDNDRVVQTVKLVGTNTVQKMVPDQITVGKAFVIDPLENYVSHMVDACLLSSARTGMCAVQAMDLLSPPQQRLVIIGAGRVGYYTALYAASLGYAKEVVFCDQNQEHSRCCVNALRLRCPQVAVEELPVEKIEAADILVMATTSRESLYSSGDFPARLVISLGADINYQHELNIDLASDAAIFVDTMDSIRYGDLRLWLAQGVIHKGQLLDMFDLLRDRSRGETTAVRKLFVSTGSALFDNLALGYILEQI